MNINFRQTGISIAELLISITLLGVISTLTINGFLMNNAMNLATYNQVQTINNQSIASALLLSAKYDSNLKLKLKLPEPYTSNDVNAGEKYVSTIVNLASSDQKDVDLINYIQQQGLSASEANNDNKPVPNARVYQKVSGLTKTMKLYTLSGPDVTLTYDFGVVYQSQCPLIDDCNKTPVPGKSPMMKNDSYTTWKTEGDDFGAAFVSTLPLQESMLTLTLSRLETIRSNLLAASAQFRLAINQGSSNGFPAPKPTIENGQQMILNLGQKTASSNQGCHDGWYALNDAKVDVLAQIGLGQKEYGETAWGGELQYCREYDLSILGANRSFAAPPYYAALRFNQSVSTAIAPDGRNILNNIIISF